MTRMAPAIVGVVVLLYCGVAAAEPNPQGKPKGMDSGQTLRWYAWHDGDGWHVRTTTKSRKHHFEGTIRVVGGSIREVHAAKLERKGRERDWWTLSDSNRVLTLDFATDSGMDGFDFTVSPKAGEVVFDLRIDNERRPEHIYIGRSADHPARSRFTVPAHPGRD